jgi:hypothetical protein
MLGLALGQLRTIPILFMPTSNNRTENSFPWATTAVISCVLLALVILLIANDGLPARDYPRAQKNSCATNLNQIGIAFRQWAVGSFDSFSFNVSTNAGGTLELCAVGIDGFDRSAVRHFQALSNELSTPKILVCPRDKARKPAVDFASLQAGNVTYQLRSGTNVSDVNPREVLAVCPIDGNILYCDGTVIEAKKE